MTDLTILIAAVCALIGYMPFIISEMIMKKGRYNILNYSKKLFIFVIGGAVIGFLIGFLGPIILSPNANQGPLLGIFITGPAGAIIGLLYFWGKLLRQQPKENK